MSVDVAIGSVDAGRAFRLDVSLSSVMTGEHHGSTTASISTLPHAPREDPTPGLVLVYSRLHSHLPSSLPLDTKETTLGRETNNSLSIAESAVSRYHARITRTDAGDILEDLGSTNGTLVNGVRIERHALSEHDIVRVGDTIFRYAASNVYAYGPYRVDGTVVMPARTYLHRPSETLIGGYQMDRLVGLIDKIAATPLSVVVHGESGTGKELVARELHSRSKRRGPFQAINCAALPANLLESELFGYRKGAFTGATSDKIGLIQSADKGTLFLDEIGDMPLEAQAKLLRVLQQREVLPLGATVPEAVDVRVVCATHRDLEARALEETFRGDLLARLREVEVVVPPLRERIEDLYVLTRHFLNAAGHGELELSFAYMLCLAHYRWPYNVRELESAAKLSVALLEEPLLDVSLLPRGIQDALNDHGKKSVAPRPPSPQPPSPQPRSGTPNEAELRGLLEKHGGNIAAVSRELGKERMQIHRWAKRYGIDLDSFRGG